MNFPFKLQQRLKSSIVFLLFTCTQLLDVLILFNTYFKSWQIVRHFYKCVTLSFSVDISRTTFRIGLIRNLFYFDTVMYGLDVNINLVSSKYAISLPKKTVALKNFLNIKNKM